MAEAREGKVYFSIFSFSTFFLLIAVVVGHANPRHYCISNEQVTAAGGGTTAGLSICLMVMYLLLRSVHLQRREPRWPVELGDSIGDQAHIIRSALAPPWLSVELCWKIIVAAVVCRSFIRHLNEDGMAKWWNGLAEPPANHGNGQNFLHACRGLNSGGSMVVDTNTIRHRFFLFLSTPLGLSAYWSNTLPDWRWSWSFYIVPLRGKKVKLYGKDERTRETIQTDGKNKVLESQYGSSTEELVWKEWCFVGFGLILRSSVSTNYCWLSCCLEVWKTYQFVGIR